MRLRKIILHGFKSFADRTELTFEEDLVGIVGPNGCGKSNIVDAFKWVLGEQSAKSLRGSQMLDVIFNGSSSRKSMGMAEVSVVLEASGSLAEQFGEEIVITRRLYRSGQSEYIINNKQARLKDIRDIMLDAGMGVDAYSLIEQGKVDLLLQASNEDRRLVLEEASGIGKYRIKKREAQRKLDTVQQNLLRLGDIIAELEKQLRSIKLQAGKARNYMQYKEQLDDLRRRFYLAEYHSLMVEQAKLRAELDKVNGELDSLRIESSRLDAQQSSLNLKLMEYATKISDLDTELAGLQSNIDTARNSLKILYGRYEELVAKLEDLRRRYITFDSELVVLSRDKKRLLEDISDLDSEIKRLEGEYLEDQERIREYDLTLSDLRWKIDTQGSDLIEIMRVISSINNKLSQIRLQLNNIAVEREKLLARKDRLKKDRDSLLAGLEESKAEYEQRLTEKDRLEKELSSLLADSEVLNIRSKELSEKLSELRERRSAVKSRVDLLEDMERSKEGISDAVKQIFEQPEFRELACNASILADLVKVKEYANLIELALAGREQYIVLESEEKLIQFKDLIDSLDGRVGFFVLNSLPPVVNPRNFSQFDGVIGRAIDFVRPREDAEELIKLLLSKVVIVKDLDTALKLSRLDNSSTRFVSLDGKIVEPDGSICFGFRSASSGLLSRRAELEKLKEQIRDLDLEIDRLGEEFSSLTLQKEDLKIRQTEIRKLLHSEETKIIELKTSINNYSHQLNKLDEALPLIGQELSMLEEQEDTLNNQQADLLSQLRVEEEKQADLKEKLDQLELSLRDTEEERQRLVDHATTRKVQLAELAERKRSLEGSLGTFARQEDKIRREREEIGSEISSTCERLSDLELTILRTESKLAEDCYKKQLVLMNSARLRAERTGIVDLLNRLSSDHKEIKDKLSSIQQLANSLAIKINEYTVKQETLIQRAYEELGVQLSVLYNDYKDGEEIGQEGIKEELLGKIEELRGKILRLGNVNLDAIEEQKQIEERLSFLTNQQKDLLEAKRRLEELIKELDEESKKRFIQTFEQVRENFGELFRKLFGGGKAELILDDPDNVLESGVDIIARPPGKESRSISLLSGGEKTLTTVALLLAIFKSRPAPFCILDEVDAALDEANIDRFNLVIQEFSEHSQFIVITHNKRTMSYLKALYGITMQEAGVSKVVAVKFDDKAGGREEHEAA